MQANVPNTGQPTADIAPVVPLKTGVKLNSAAKSKDVVSDENVVAKELVQPNVADAGHPSGDTSAVIDAANAVSVWF